MPTIISKMIPHNSIIVDTAPAISEVLTLGVPDENNECILVALDRELSLGAKLY